MDRYLDKDTITQSLAQVDVHRNRRQHLFSKSNSTMTYRRVIHCLTVTDFTFIVPGRWLLLKMDGVNHLAVHLAVQAKQKTNLTWKFELLS
jgi:hypothetical protein